MAAKRISKNRTSSESATMPARQRGALRILHSPDFNSPESLPSNPPALFMSSQKPTSPTAPGPIPSHTAFAEVAPRIVAAETRAEHPTATKPVAESVSAYGSEADLGRELKTAPSPQDLHGIQLDDLLPQRNRVDDVALPAVVTVPAHSPDSSDKAVEDHKQAALRIEIVESGPISPSTSENPPARGAESAPSQPGILEMAALLSEANKRIAQADEAFLKARKTLEEAQVCFDKSTALLQNAQQKEEQAREDLKSTQLELMTAYQFASVAAQRQKNAAAYYRRANKWTIVASTIAWVSVTWLAWVVLQARVPIWAPGFATAALGFAARYIFKWADYDS